MTSTGPPRPCAATSSVALRSRGARCWRAGCGAGLTLYAAKALPVSRMFEAAAADAAASPNAPVLVSVFLPGGVDLLDTLVPLHDYGRYADLHKQLKVEGIPLAGGSGLGLNPSMSRGVRGGVKGLFERGKIGFLPGIDYPDPDLSHFHSRHFWETGLITDNSAPGWLGRWLDRAGGKDNPLQGISMGYGLSPVLRSARAPVAAVAAPDDAGFWIRSSGGALRRGDEDLRAARARRERKPRPRGIAYRRTPGEGGGRAGWSPTPSTTAATRSRPRSPIPPRATSDAGSATSRR